MGAPANLNFIESHPRNRATNFLSHISYEVRADTTLALLMRIVNHEWILHLGELFEIIEADRNSGVIACNLGDATHDGDVKHCTSEIKMQRSEC